MPKTDCCRLFAPDLALLHSPTDIGAYLKARHAEGNTPDAVREDSRALLARNTALVDAVLRRLFALALEHALPLAPPDAAAAPPLAVVATGGYGRRELAPFSDVDVTFVAAREDDPYLNALIKDMFQSVMDVFMYGAGLKVGYAYRLLGDLGQLDHQTQTALLDARLLCGDLSLFKSFRLEFRAHLLTAHFMFEKWAERQSVLLKFGGDQVYGVEPNVKESAGGLRDIHTAEWIGEVRFHVGLPRLWPVLVEQQMLSSDEAQILLAARNFLLQVRNALHVVSGEARDVLTAEKQEAVAALLAYPDLPDVPAVESFMRDYFTQAAHAHRLSRKVVHGCLHSEIPLGLGLASVGRHLVVSDPDAALRDAALPLHMAELSQAYGLHIPSQTEDVVACFVAATPAPVDMPLAGRVFTRLLTRGPSVADSLDRLQEWGVLGWLIPAFAPLMALIPYDAAHDFTVGAHSLRVVRYLQQMWTDPDPKMAHWRRLVGEVAFPEVLALAGLLHDIGKQWTTGPHDQTGAVAAEQIAAHLGWDAERTAKLVFLIRYHLLMAETSRLRDLSLDETLRDFLHVVPDLDSLTMLYLLTYADTNAVGAGIWTEVKGKFLAELYHRAEGALQSAAPGDEPHVLYVPNMARQRERIRKGLARHDLPPDLIYEHTRNLPAQYLLNTPLEEMYLHIAMIGRLRETFQPIVDFKTEFGEDYTELTLCAYDDPHPGLLAKITGVLYALDVNVHVAQVFTREASVRIAIDTLWIDYRGKPLTASKKSEVQDTLRQVLLGETGTGALLQQRRKEIKEQAIYSATIDDGASERFSLLEVSAPDERGVLYRLTRIISQLGWNIHAARLSVWGSRARDAFYITAPDGEKVPRADVERLLSVLPHATDRKKKRASGYNSPV